MYSNKKFDTQMVKHTHLNRIVIHIRTIFYIQFHSSSNLLPWISSHWDRPLSFHFVESSHMELNHYTPQQRQYLEAPNGMLKHCIQVRQEFGSQKSSALLLHAHYLQVPFISKCCDVVFFSNFSSCNQATFRSILEMCTSTLCEPLPLQGVTQGNCGC